MSQLTFDGIVDDKDKPVIPEVPIPESWYKGRTLSHSSMGMYRTCPQRWKFRYIDKVPEKPRSFFSFGKSVHNGLEFLYEKLGEPIPSLDELIANFKNGWIREGYETPAQEKWFYQEGERILRGFYAKHQSDHKKVFQVEFHFTIPIEGVPVTGFIDRIDNTPSGGLALLDYKTGKAFDKARVRTDAQLTLYQLAVETVFKKPVETVTLYHLNSLTPLTVPAHSKKMEENLKVNVVETAKGIMEGKFEPKPDERGHCQWCDYAQICPAMSGKKIIPGAKAPDAELIAKADRLGKLDVRISELQQERLDLKQEISTAMRASGKDEVKGTHFTVKQTPAADQDPADPNKPLTTFPSEGETPS